MYGGSSKLGGRGAGRGGGANTKPLTSSFSRPPPRPTSSRLPLNSRNNTRPSAAMEEIFSLVPGNNLPAFAMTIRLTPDLVDEIKRVESQGGAPRIRFGSAPNNASGNVIDVGGKEFKFTWSKEMGDLCDIYEERQSGEDGSGLMVESGCAWRKVNVQRILDESTKNHVKMRSVEAELKIKSRKAIVLEPGNPTMKNNIKQLQAAEGSPWMRMPFKQKKEPPFKKRKVEPPQVGGPPKSTFKPGLVATSSTKGRRSSSPLPSLPERSGTPASPFAVAGIAKSQLSTEEISVTQRKGKESTSTTEKENPTRANSAVQETPGRKWNPEAKSLELESMLITLLTENPKGMKLKDIEKAIDDTIPNPAKKIEPILKKIANVQAPGKYVLKPEMELESFKKPSSESESSPEEIYQHVPTPEDDHRHIHAPEPRVAEKSPANLEGLSQLGSKLGEEPNVSEKIDIEQQSPYIFGAKNVDNSEGLVASSSDSGTDSDSESDSSDSGSDSVSRSRSRSRSQAESGSGSSSDSETDVSSNSKEGSDEDVDIMTSDDDKEPQKQLQLSEPVISASPDPWRSVPNETDDKQDGDESDAVDIEGHESGAVDIERDFLDQKETEITTKKSLVSAEEGENLVDGAKSFPSAQARETFVGSLFDYNETFEKGSDRCEQSDSSEMIAKGKSKRGCDMKYGDGKSDRAKRAKAENFSQPPISGGRDAQYLEDPQNRLTEDTYRVPENQMMNRADRDGHGDFGSRKGNSQAFHGKSSSDFQQTERRSFDQNARGKAPDTAGRPKNAENLGYGHKFPEKVNHAHDSFPPQREKAPRDIHNEDNPVKDKKVSRNPKEGGPGGRHSTPFDNDFRKQGELFGKLKDAAQVTNSHMDSNKADTDKTPSTSGRGLQRELSDLEMGELREPLPEEKPVKKQFERKGSFKQSENKPSASDNHNLDTIKGKHGGKTASDLGKPSPNIGTGVKQTPDHHNEAIMRSCHKNVQSQPQNILRADAPDIGPQISKLADTNSRYKQNEPGTKLGNGVESSKKASYTGQHVHDSKRSQSAAENKTQTSHTAADLTDRRMDANLTKGGRRKRESSSEEDNFSYSKYEKDVPDLKGPIKDLSQYKEYAQEYRDKYDIYCSVNMILEKYRNEFLKMGKDLELAKNRDPDRYNKILEQLKESYRQCGMKHKRLKKIFIILHKELESLKQRIKDFAQLHTTD